MNYFIAVISARKARSVAAGPAVGGGAVRIPCTEPRVRPTSHSQLALALQPHALSFLIHAWISHESPLFLHLWLELE